MIILIRAAGSMKNYFSIVIGLHQESALFLNIRSKGTHSRFKITTLKVCYLQRMFCYSIKNLLDKIQRLN